MNNNNQSNPEYRKLYEKYLKLGFEEGNLKDPHQDFWEVYLANALLGKDIPLCKDPRSGGAPDFFFENDRTKIHIEATAPGPGEGKHAVAPMPIIRDENPGEFESGFVPADQIRLRFTNALQMKTAQIKKWKDETTIAADDAVILAINGFEALGGRADIDGMLEPQFIVQVLHEIGDSFMTQNGERFLAKTNMIRKGADTIRNEWSFFSSVPICGVLYSNVSIGELSSEHRLGQDFKYFQNPSMMNLRKHFDLWP